MLSPEESIKNSARSCDEQDVNYDRYIRFTKIFHRTELIILGGLLIQLFTFFSLMNDWYSSFIYDEIVNQLLSWQFNDLVILFSIKVIQIALVVVTFKILRRLKKVLFDESHKAPKILGWLITQELLLILIPNTLNFCLILIILAMWIRMEWLHRIT